MKKQILLSFFLVKNAKLVTSSFLHRTILFCFFFTRANLSKVINVSICREEAAQCRRGFLPHSKVAELNISIYHYFSKPNFEVTLASPVRLTHRHSPSHRHIATWWKHRIGPSYSPNSKHSLFICNFDFHLVETHIPESQVNWSTESHVRS